MSFAELVTTLGEVVPDSVLAPSRRELGAQAPSEPEPEPDPLAPAPPPPPQPAALGFDLASAMARAGGDHALMQELLDVFLVEAPVWLSSLDAAFAGRDGAALRGVAHTIKGAVDTCGVRGGFDAALTIERLALEEPFERPAVEREIAGLRAAIDAALPAMRAMRAVHEEGAA